MSDAQSGRRRSLQWHIARSYFFRPQRVVLSPSPQEGLEDQLLGLVVVALSVPDKVDELSRRVAVVRQAGARRIRQRR